MDVWTVGQLAKAAGISVRTLHHYHEKHLLVPRLRSSGGYRLYTIQDMARLQQIMLLRQMGLSLDEIRASLADAQASLPDMIMVQIQHLKAQIAAQQQICHRLELLVAELHRTEQHTSTDPLAILQLLVLSEQYYPPALSATIEQRRAAISPHHMRAVSDAWVELITEVRAAMQGGMLPASPPAQQLAARWFDLVQVMTGGDALLEQAMRQMYMNEPAIQQYTAIDPAMFAFVVAAHQSFAATNEKP